MNMNPTLSLVPPLQVDITSTSATGWNCTDFIEYSIATRVKKILECGPRNLLAWPASSLVSVKLQNCWQKRKKSVHYISKYVKSNVALFLNVWTLITFNLNDCGKSVKSLNAKNKTKPRESSGGLKKNRASPGFISNYELLMCYFSHITASVVSWLCGKLCSCVNAQVSLWLERVCCQRLAHFWTLLSLQGSCAVLSWCAHNPN